MEVNEGIRAAGCGLFAIDPHSLRSLNGIDSAVYVGRRSERAYVLKFIATSADQKPAIEEKVRFLHYLGENGANVVAPLPSQANHLLEQVEDNGKPYAVLLTNFASGIKPNAIRTPNEWNEVLFYRWGRAAGRLHALARAYPAWFQPASSLPAGAVNDSPPHPTTLIDDWKNELSRRIDQCQDTRITQALQAFLPQMECLPRTRNNYGLIHNDLRHHHILYDPRAYPGKEISIIDFNASAYHWFMSDIASSLYHAMMETMDDRVETRTAFAQRFLPAFLRGYNQEYELDRFWFQTLNLFLQHSQVLAYTNLSKHWPAGKRMKWQEKYLTHMRRSITNQVALLPETYIASL